MEMMLMSLCSIPKCAGVEVTMMSFPSTSSSADLSPNIHQRVTRLSLREAQRDREAQTRSTPTSSFEATSRVSAINSSTVRAADLVGPIPKRPRLWSGRANGQSLTFPPRIVVECAYEQKDRVLTLQWKALARPKPKVGWSFNKAPLRPDGERVKMEMKRDQEENSLYHCVLTIDKCSSTNSGNYSCRIYNDEGEVVTNLEVDLTNLSPPVFVAQPKLVKQENIWILECRVESHTLPEITWQKDENLLVFDDRVKPLLRAEGELLYFVGLEIKRPVPEDSALYLVTAKNANGKTQANFKLDVREPHAGVPKFTDSPKLLPVPSVDGHSTYAFEVFYESESFAKVFWYSPRGRKLREAHKIRYFTTEDKAPHTYICRMEMRLPRFERPELGEYKCVVSNPFGSIESHVEIKSSDPIFAVAEWRKKLESQQPIEELPVSFATTAQDWTHALYLFQRQSIGFYNRRIPTTSFYTRAQMQEILAQYRAMTGAEVLRPSVEVQDQQAASVIPIASSSTSSSSSNSSFSIQGTSGSS